MRDRKKRCSPGNSQIRSNLACSRNVDRANGSEWALSSFGAVKGRRKTYTFRFARVY